MELILQTSVIDCVIKLRDKYAFISGFSGRGKSLFIKELADNINIQSVNLKCDLPIVVVNTISELQVLDTANRSFIIACDEFLAHDVLMVIKDTECYAICVTRKTYTDINYSDRCLYSAIRDGSDKTVIREKGCLPTNQAIDCFDVVVTEDSAAGCKFMEHLFPDKKVVAAGSKRVIVDTLRREYSENGTVLCCDRGGVGNIYNRLLTQINKRQNLLVILPECFEHILLCSEFIAHPIDILSHFEPKYNNTENFCECRIAELTKNKPYMYNHKYGNLSMCWIEDCSICGKNCNYSVSGDKVQSVLKNGPAKVLLEYYKRNTDESQTAGDILDKIETY